MFSISKGLNIKLTIITSVILLASFDYSQCLANGRLNHTQNDAYLEKPRIPLRLYRGDGRSSELSSIGNLTLNDSMPTRRTGSATRLNSTNQQQEQLVNNKNDIKGIQARQWHGTEQDDYRVPFWNIAHMINSIEQIEPALREGSNGIEVDVSFDKQGIPTQTYHGFPCDCGRHCHHSEDFTKFIKHLGFISSPPEFTKLQLVLFDLKLKDLGTEQKRTAGKYLASIIWENLYKRYIEATGDKQGLLFQPPVRVIISINYASDNVLVRSFIHHMKTHRLDPFMNQHVGFDVGMNDALSNISTMWTEMNGATHNIWQGDGLTNCANLIRGVDRLKEAISIRNSQGHFRKIYYWTADIMYQIRSILRLGIDAILTNQPQRVVQVLEEPEFRGKYRLATPYDDPFAQFRIQPSAWQMSPPTLSETVETLSNIQKTSADFVRTIPNGVGAVIRKVHNSITLI